MPGCCSTWRWTSSWRSRRWSSTQSSAPSISSSTTQLLRTGRLMKVIGVGKVAETPGGSSSFFANSFEGLCCEKKNLVRLCFIAFLNTLKVYISLFWWGGTCGVWKKSREVEFYCIFTSNGFYKCFKGLQRCTLIFYIHP